MTKNQLKNIKSLKKAKKELQVRFRPHLEANLEENWFDPGNENESKIDKNPPKTEKKAPQKSTFF